MRYQCQEPGFEDAFLEIPETGWTRAHLRQLRELDESAAWFDTLRFHVTALHLPVVEGDAVTTPAGLVPEVLDRLDLVVYNWLIAAIVEAMRNVTHLGNAPWRRLSGTQETGVATNPQSQSSTP